MTVMQNNFRLSAVAIALLLVFGPAMADDEEIAELIKPESSISVGAGRWSSDRRQQGMYDGMRDSGVYGLLDTDIVKRDDATGTWYKLKATNLGLDNREIKGEYLRQGNFGITLEYNRITRDDPKVYNTTLQGVGTTNQTVSATPATSPRQLIELGTVREGIGLGIYKNLFPGLEFNLSVKNEDKTGTRNWGRGSAPEFAVEPIDSSIRQIEGVLSYTTKKFQISGGYYGSWYDNKNSLVTINTAGQVAANVSGVAPNQSLNLNRTFLSLPLDNQAHQFFLNGGYSFTPTTRATVKMSYTRATQDEHLPTRDLVVAGYGPVSFSGAPSSLNGEVNTTLVQLGLTSRPTKDFSLLANLRYHDVDDATPVARFVNPVNPVTGAVLPCGSGNQSNVNGFQVSLQCVDNTPLSYRTISGKLEGTYRLGDGYSAIAGLDQRHQNRAVPVSNALGTGGTDNQRVVPMRSKLDETTWRLELRRSLSEVLNGSLSYVGSQRTGSSYVFAAGPGNDSTNGFTNISNQINPINIADRQRNKIRLAVDWTPIESLSFQFTVEEGRDKYDHDATRSFGLQEGTASLYGIDASYTLSDKWKFNAWYSYDYNQAKQKAPRASNGGGNAAIKDYNLEDAGNSFGLGVRGEVTSRVKLGGDLQVARNVSRYQQTVTALNGTPGTNTVANFAPGLPDIENKLTRLSLFSMYALDKNSDLRLDLISERWKTNDWSWMFANGSAFTYGTTTDGTTVTSNPRQISTFIGMRYIYKFQ